MPRHRVQQKGNIEGHISKLFQCLQDWNSLVIFAKRLDMIEQPPKYCTENMPQSQMFHNQLVTEAINKLQDSYAYWSEVKYKQIKEIPC